MQSNQAQNNPTNSLSARDRLRLLERVFKDGVSVSDACRAFNISRNTFYKWARRNSQRIKSGQDELQSLQNQNPRRRRASQQRIPIETEQIIRGIVALHPGWGKRRIHTELRRRIISVGIHGVGNALTRLQLNTPQLRQRYHEALASNTPLGKLLTAQDRARLVERVLRGRIPLSIVSRDCGVSRLTLYKWLGRYNRALRDDKDVLGALEDRERRVERWGNQATGEQERQVLEIVRTAPAWGKYRLSQKLREQYGFISLGIHGVSNVLKRNDLATAQQRKTWAAIQIEPAVRPQAGWEERPKQVLEEFIPGLAPAPPPGVSPFFQVPVGTWLRRFAPYFFLSLLLLIGLYGWGYLLGSAQTPSQVVGFTFASIALSMGSVFFLYSLKYYFTLAVVLSFSREADAADSQKLSFEQRKAQLSSTAGWLRRLFGINLSRSGNEASPVPGTSLSQVGGPASPSQGGLEPDLSQIELERRPFISVHLPMYNEKRVAERLLRACVGFEYPNYEVVVADDSTDETTGIVERFLQAHGTTQEFTGEHGNRILKVHPSDPGAPSLTLIHRADRAGFKGGALREALRVSDPRAEFVVVFDADFVPYPDTLELFLKYFQVNAGSLGKLSFSQRKAQLSSQRYAYQDSNVAAIQGYQWHVLNKSENWITRGVRSEYAGSYVIERSGTELYGGLKQIAGSVYMIRRDLLDTFGWGTSITEDFQLTLKLYEQGYKVVYTPYIQAPAECASTLKRLIRQRMRWAEGHSFNIRKMFLRLLFGGWGEGTGESSRVNNEVRRMNYGLNSHDSSFMIHDSKDSQKQGRVWRPSPLSLSEKLEFLYLSPYYLQAAFFLLGTIGWIVSETVYKARLPFWTSVWGWSLVLTNLISLPLMNTVGLFLEEAEEKDFSGTFSFILLTYLLVPFQAYASIKGFLEQEEGPWFRTPKTGKITDILTRGRFYRFIRGIFPGRLSSATEGIANRIWPLGNFLNPKPYTLDPHFATANHRFDSFAIKPKGSRFLGNSVLLFAFGTSLALSYLGDNIRTGSLADLPIQTRVEKVGEDRSLAAGLLGILSPDEVMAASDKVQGVFISGVKQVPMETLIASLSLVLLLTLALLLHLYKKKRKLFRKALQSILVFSLIVSWLLSGWPVLWQNPRFPPEIKEARATISEVSASANQTLDQTSDTLVGSMTFTPAAGDYLAVFTGYLDAGGTAKNYEFSLYVGGAIVQHTERAVDIESSIAVAGISVGVATHAHVSVNGSQAIEVRYRRTSGTTASTMKNRTFTLFPKAAADFRQVTATANATVSATTDTLLTGMTDTPPAGTYLLVFSDSADNSAAGIKLFHNVYVGGSIVGHTERALLAEGSISANLGAMPSLIAAKVTVNGSQAVEIRARRVTNNWTVYERTLTLMKVEDADIKEATATADSTVTGTAYELLNSMSIADPGVADWLTIFSSSTLYDTVSTDNTALYSIFNAGVQDTDSERLFAYENSLDGTDYYAFSHGRITVAGATDDVEIRWGSNRAVESRTAHQRTLVMVKVPAFNQSAYRFFNNDADNDTDVGAVLADRDTPATLTSDGQEFRLRLLIHVSDAQLALNGQNFKLQIASKVGGACDTNMATTDESYSDLSPSSGTIRYYDDTDSNKTDGANLIANGNDPTHSTDNVVEQDYEEANNFTDTVALIPAGEDGEWDFSIIDFSAADSTTYCLRVLESGGTLLTTYAVVPEFTTVPENPILLFGFSPVFLGILRKLKKGRNA